jgi:TonB family protein
MTSEARPVPRLWRLIIASVAVHAGIFGTLWGVLHQHPSLLLELGSGASQSTPPLLIEEIDPSPPSRASESKKAKNPVLTQPVSGQNSATATQSLPPAPSKADAGSESIGTTDPYYSAVRSKIQSQVHYTPAMARRRLQGQVQVALTLQANGSISSLYVSHSSGTNELDQLALNSVRAAAPFPTFQSTNPTRKLELPIDFRLH